MNVPSENGEFCRLAKENQGKYVCYISL